MSQIQSYLVVLVFSALALAGCGPRDLAAERPVLILTELGRSLSGCQKDQFYVVEEILEGIKTGEVRRRVSFGNYNCSVVGAELTLVSDGISSAEAGSVVIDRVEVWATDTFKKQTASENQTYGNLEQKYGFKKMDDLFFALKRESSDRHRVNQNFIIIEYFRYKNSDSDSGEE